VLGRLDNAVCAAAPAYTPYGNDGVFGVGGNGAKIIVIPVQNTVIDQK
jgi:hypothetical protein